MSVRRTGSSCDQGFHQVNTGLVNAYVDSVGVFTRQCVAQISQLLGKSDYFRLWWGLVLGEAGLVVVFVVCCISLHVHVLKAELLKQGTVLLRHWEGKCVTDFVFVA